MPRYFFHSEDGHLEIDETGTELRPEQFDRQIILFRSFGRRARGGNASSRPKPRLSLQILRARIVRPGPFMGNACKRCCPPHAQPP